MLSNSVRVYLSSAEYNCSSWKRISSIVNLNFIGFAGTPTATQYVGTSLVTQAFIATTAPSPILIPPFMVTPLPIHTSFPIYSTPIFHQQEFIEFASLTICFTRLFKSTKTIGEVLTKF